MKSIADKIETHRSARAQGLLRMAPESVRRIRENDLPKKDVLAVARVAAVMAAKNTGQFIPYCHPIPVEHVAIDFELENDAVIATATVQSIGKTGVEMEALAAASVALLTVYDMVKCVDAGQAIEAVRLLEKRGGKSSFIERLPEGFEAGVLVSSDGTYAGKREDKSGKLIRERLESYGIATHYVILPDEEDRIAEQLESWCASGVRLIITTGGTGLGPRDVMVEATRRVMDREVPGIMEAARSFGQRRTPYAMLSRGLAAQKGGALIVNLPGSSNGARESLDAVFPGILHAYGMMAGGGH